MTARRTVDDDLDNFGKYFYYNDLERHIRRYSSSKLRKKNFRHAGVLAKSGVLMKKDLHLQKEKMLRIYIHIEQLMTHRVLIRLIIILCDI